MFVRACPSPEVCFLTNILLKQHLTQKAPLRSYNTYIYNTYIYNTYIYNTYIYNAYIYNTYIYNTYIYNTYIYNTYIFGDIPQVESLEVAHNSAETH